MAVGVGLLLVLVTGLVIVSLFETIREREWFFTAMFLAALLLIVGIVGSIATIALNYEVNWNWPEVLPEQVVVTR
jgi:hypothetical protein